MVVSTSILQFYELQAVPVMSEEDEVSLVVKRGNSATLKLWIMGKQGGKQTTNSVTQSSVEVV